MEATATAPAADLDPQTRFRIRPITVDEYHRMLDAGILSERERIELLDGQLIAMPPEGSAHGCAITKTAQKLIQCFAGRAMVRPGNALRLSPTSEPQPDFALVRPRDDWYAEALPVPSDVLLLVEVSDSTLGFDRREKLLAYARAGIEEFWIVDLVHDCVQVHVEPSQIGYGSVRVAQRGDVIAPRAFPDEAIPIAALLP